MLTPATSSPAALASGWNTWNTNSVLSFVHLPSAFCFTLSLKEYSHGRTLQDCFLGPIGTDGTIVPRTHTALGEYLSLEIFWLGMQCRVQAARVEADYVVQVSPQKNPAYPPTLVVESGFLWGYPGLLSKEGACLAGISDAGTHRVYPLGTERIEKNVHCHGPHLTFSHQEALSISTGISRSSDEIERLLDEAHNRAQAGHFADPQSRELSEAIESVIAWNTIYEPSKGRIVSPVSRKWSAEDHGGYMLFVWDTFFASLLASVHSKELAYANARAIVSERLAEGYLPAMACNLFNRGKDRSQPPVGSLCVSLIAHHFQDATLISELFDELYGWNTWYDATRQIEPGLFAWGYSHKYCTSTNANFESGLDNTPMYDGVPTQDDGSNVQMCLADVGFTSLMAMDSRILAGFAQKLGKTDIARKLLARATCYEAGLETLWSEEKGIYLNKRTDTGELSARLSPTLFYPLLTNAVCPDRAARMLKEHFYNPEEFWGEWMLPSIARNDPAFSDQHYWRGPVWAPMNFLVYLGLSKAGLSEARADLAAKSTGILLKEYRSHGHIHENWNSENGEGCPSGTSTNKSDPFYTWGALMALIGLIQNGSFDLSPDFLPRVAS